jgi:hypothetical protein
MKIQTAPGLLNLGSRYETGVDQQVRLLDDQELRFGTSGDSRIYYDGTDTFLDLRVAGTGDWMIGLAASFPSPDPDNVHIWKGDAGTVSGSTGTAVIIEDSTNTGLSILTPVANHGSIRFGNPDDDSSGIVRYYGSGATPADTLEFFTGATGRVRISAATFDLRTAGMDLDINAGFIQLAEMTAPGAGAADHVRIYAEVSGGLTDLSAVFQDGTIVDFAEEVTPLDAPIHVSPDRTSVTLEFRKPHPGISEIVAVFPDGRTHCMWRAKFHDTAKINANRQGAERDSLPGGWLQETAGDRKTRTDIEDAARLVESRVD